MSLRGADQGKQRCIQTSLTEISKEEGARQSLEEWSSVPRALSKHGYESLNLRLEFTHCTTDSLLLHNRNFQERATTELSMSYFARNGSLSA